MLKDSVNTIDQEQLQAEDKYKNDRINVAINIINEFVVLSLKNRNTLTVQQASRLL